MLPWRIKVFAIYDISFSASIDAVAYATVQRKELMRKSTLQNLSTYKTGIRFSSAVTGECFKVKTTATSKTSDVVSLIDGSRCTKQYVGETENALQLCLNGH